MASVSDIAFTPAVKRVQEDKGSRKGYARMAERGDWNDRVDDHLAAFIAARDSLYFGTASAAGQPYIQHRGGPVGFLKVLDDRTLAFADFVGNRQYISIGNLSENDLAYLFLMDYPNRQRIKIWGRAEVIEDDPELLKRLHDVSYRGKPRRVIKFHIKAWDRNCPQHIKPRFSAEESSSIIERMKTRIADLEAQLEQAPRALSPR